MDVLGAINPIIQSKTRLYVTHPPTRDNINIDVVLCFY
jgi:hypothetical protein